MELGTVATPFEHRSYGTELALCQRYYYEMVNGTFTTGAGGTSYGNWFFPVTMRAVPTFTLVGGRTSSSTAKVDRVYITYGGAYAQIGEGSNVSAEL